jgi:N6-adenosine-specific RNA methylase IME4
MSDLNHFDLIYADPAWSYNNKRTGGSMTSGAGQVYPVMTPDEIAALPVGLCAADNAICGLWITNPILDVGCAILKSWGFEYKTDWPWVKTGRLGLGFWGRCDVEHLLIGVKGNIAPPRFGTTRSCLMANPSGHSEKPEAMRQRLVECIQRSFGRWGTLMMPTESNPSGIDMDGSYSNVILKPFNEIQAVELFARRVVPGWTCIGNEINSSVEDFLAPWQAIADARAKADHIEQGELF